jgi:hypothetical protein
MSSANNDVFWVKQPATTVGLDTPIVTATVLYSTSVTGSIGPNIVFTGSTEASGSLNPDSIVIAQVQNPTRVSTSGFFSGSFMTGNVLSGSNDGMTIWRMSKTRSSDYFTGSQP